MENSDKPMEINPAALVASYTFPNIAWVYQPENIRVLNDIRVTGYVTGSKSKKEEEIEERISKQERIPKIGSMRKHRNGGDCMVLGMAVEEEAETIAVLYGYEGVEHPFYWTRDLDEWESELEDETSYKFPDTPGLPAEGSKWKHWKENTYVVDHYAVHAKTKKISLLYRIYRGDAPFWWMRDLDSWNAKLEDGRDRFTRVS